MLKSYLTIAWRQLLKNRGYSILNIGGLAIGMAIALIIGLWVADELSFDHYYKDHDRIGAVLQVNRNMKGPHNQQTASSIGETVSSALGPFLRKGYDDVFQQTAMITHPQKSLLVSGESSVSRLGSWAQASLPSLFGFQFITGSAAALRDPSTALISQSTAIALFGKQDPLNKTIHLGNNKEFRIGGVYADLPMNTTFYKYDYLLSWENPDAKWVNANTDFNDHDCRMYVRLAANATMEGATNRIRNICTPFAHYWGSEESYQVFPLEDLHLKNIISDSDANFGRIGFVRLIGTIGIFVLLLACINFMNLSTARSERRAKEVGIRKTVGSLRRQLIGQFLGESLLVAGIAFLFAILLAWSSLPWFNLLSDKQMTFPWTSLSFWVCAIAFTLLTGIISGSYPAFYLSSFRPVKVLKGAFRAGRYAGLPRQVLVIAQFSISLSLIIGTIVVFRQIAFARNRPIGYNRAGLITVRIDTDTLRNNADALRLAVLGSGVATNMALSSQPTTQFDQNNSIEWEGQQPDQLKIYFRDVWATPEFGPTVGWTVIQGRDFSRAYGTDTSACIINEEGAREMGLKDPIGKVIKHWNTPYTIIGVVKNMLTNNPYDQLLPSIFLGSTGGNYITIRIDPNKPMRTALAALEPIFKRFNPASPFLYTFNDEDFERKFTTETRIGNLAAVFSGLAIFISCLGLFGLASFVAEQRTKEIGIRKVLGAGIPGIWALLSKDFLRLVVLAMFISMPIIGMAMHKWLQSYTFRTPLSWWIFGAAGAGMLLITLATVSFQSLKAAFMNPVGALRSE